MVDAGDGSIDDESIDAIVLASTVVVFPCVIEKLQGKDGKKTNEPSFLR